MIRLLAILFRFLMALLLVRLGLRALSSWLGPRTSPGPGQPAPPAPATAPHAPVPSNRAAPHAATPYNPATAPTVVQRKPPVRPWWEQER